MKYSNVANVAIFVCLLFSTIGCGKFGFQTQEKSIEISKNNPAANGENPNSSEDLITKDSDPTDAVKKAYEKMSKLRSFRLRHELTGYNGQVITTVTEVVAPDRSHSVREGAGAMETIMIGGDFYIKTPGSDWEKSSFLSETPNEAEKNKNPGGSFYEEFLKDLSKKIDIKSAGFDTIDGVPVIIYQYSFTDEINKDSVRKLWIGTRDNLIYKQENEFNSEFGGKSAKMKSAIKYYDFNADIEIEKPI